MKTIVQKWILLILLLVGPILQGTLYWRSDFKIYIEEYRCKDCRVQISYAYGKISRWQLIRFFDRPNVEFSCSDGPIIRKKSFPMIVLSWQLEFLFLLSSSATIVFILMILVSPFRNAEGRK